MERQSAQDDRLIFLLINKKSSGLDSVMRSYLTIIDHYICFILFDKFWFLNVLFVTMEHSAISWTNPSKSSSLSSLFVLVFCNHL